MRITHLLSNGDVSVRPGELRTGPRQQLIPGAGAGTGAFGDNKEWLFWSLSGREYSRERWTTLEVGRRHFLFRARARAGTRREAQRRFRAAEEWFESMILAVRIQ